MKHPWIIHDADWNEAREGKKTSKWPHYQYEVNQMFSQSSFHGWCSVLFLPSLMKQWKMRTREMLGLNSTRKKTSSLLQSYGTLNFTFDQRSSLIIIKEQSSGSGFFPMVTHATSPRSLFDDKHKISKQLIFDGIFFLFNSFCFAVALQLDRKQLE